MIIQQRRLIAIGFQARGCDVEIMLEKEKEQAGKGQMEVNWAEGIDNRGESDNHSQVEHENEGQGDYQDNWGSDLRCKIYRGQLIPHVI